MQRFVRGLDSSTLDGTQGEIAEDRGHPSFCILNFTTGLWKSNNPTAHKLTRPPNPSRRRPFFVSSCGFAASSRFVSMAVGSSRGSGRYNLRPLAARLRGAYALADSPLLGRLLQELPAVFDAEVLPLLDPTARALLARCGQACRVGPAGHRSSRQKGASQLKTREFKVRWPTWRPISARP